MRGNHQLLYQEDLSQVQSSIKNCVVDHYSLIKDKTVIEVKTKPPTPVLANDGCSGGTGVEGGFWLGSVAAGACAGATLPPHSDHPGMEPNCGSAETGFINSQPSMAEFMTALPQLSGDGPLQNSPSAVGPLSPSQHHSYHNMIDPHGIADQTNVNVPEYPWMKEKKTTRKNSQQGKSKFVDGIVVICNKIQRLLSLYILAINNDQCKI